MSGGAVEVLRRRAEHQRSVFKMKMEGTPGYYKAAANLSGTVKEWRRAGGRLRLVKNG